MASAARIRLAVATAMFVATALSPASAGAITLGVDEYGIPRATDAGRPWPTLLREANASIVRAQIPWLELAPTRPANESDPNDPAYRWTMIDNLARTADDAGSETLLNVYVAPPWAEGSGRPSKGYGKDGTEPPFRGSWKPDPVAFGKLATAIATRYSGTTPDPTRPGRFLPRIRYYEAWNEPNYKEFLTPQFELVRGLRTNTVAETYRKLLNAFYVGIKSVQPDAKVLSAGLGPYGNSSNGIEIQPQAFLRSLLCEKRAYTSVTRVPCPTKAKLDGVAHHPYTLFGNPLTKAGNVDGGALGNVPEMVAALNYAVRMNLTFPTGPKPFWVTEFGWMTDPPGLGDLSTLRIGLPPKQAGIYASETIYRFWSWGIGTAIWYHLTDSIGWPGGLMFQAGGGNPATAKPSLTAFRFPLFPKRVSGRVSVWGISPCTGDGAKVEVATSDRGRWTVSATITPPESGLFTVLAGSGLTKAARAVASGPGCSARTVTMPVYSR